MAIRKIRVANFKSFKGEEIELSNFTVLIGANASGKSNFIQIFKFLRDITNYGLDNAISMQGGTEYLRNINIGSSMDFLIEAVCDQEYSMGPIEYVRQFKAKQLIGTRAYETIYTFAMRFPEEEPGFRIVEDRVLQRFNLGSLEISRGKIKEKGKSPGQGERIISYVNGDIKVDFLKLPGGAPIKREDLFPPFLQETKLKSATLLTESPFGFMPPIFRDISIYDFDPKLPKRATPITGKAELEEDGSNLAIVLKNILENEERRRKLSNLVTDLLPFVKDLDVDKFADKSLLFKLRETYSEDKYLPASLISDGTINITALIVALYFEKKPLTIIEEPERNIHPYLISRVINMMKDASQNKQIIVTTHNPEIVKHADLENLLLVSRDRRGFSTVSKPGEKEEIKVFLENEMGIDELYVQNLLEL